MSKGLLSLFSEIPDPRRGQGKMYALAPVLLFTVLAMLAGARSYRQVHSFIEAHRKSLNSAFDLAWRKAPAYSSVRFILRGLDADAVERAFRAHAGDLHRPSSDPADPTVVAVDGKTLRRSFDAFNDRKAVHVLSAFATDGRIVLGHLAVAEKSNEIPAAQALIEALDLSGCLFTLDAMHCQKNLRGGPGRRQPPVGAGQGEPGRPA